MEEQQIVKIDNDQQMLAICGENDSNLKRLEKISKQNIFSKGNEIIFSDPYHSSIITSVIDSLKKIAQQGRKINHQIIDFIYNSLYKNPTDDTEFFLKNKIKLEKVNKIIQPLSVNQALYLEAMQKSDIVFSIGPAGCGKTYLAVAFALSMILAKEKKRLILTRPVVEAGESLGYLPGDLKAKINPFLQPLFDAIWNLVSFDIYQKMNEQNIIEIVPLAYMRGRTLSDAVVILDEAQNTTSKQMKMFLTRLGMNSKMIVTGDITQVDLPGNKKNGLSEAVHIFKKISSIEFITLDKSDVFRHPLVKKIIQAYEEKSKKKA